MKKLLSCILTLALLLSLAACTGGTPANTAEPSQNTAEASDASQTAVEGSENETIRIGVMNSFTGGNAAYGEHEYRGIKLANKLFPEVNGHPIELVVVDNKSDSVESANAAQRLVEHDKCTMILGSYGSSICMAAGDAIMQGQVPTITATATNANVTLGNPYYYRACFLDAFQTPVCAQFCYNDKGYRTAGLIYEITNDASVAQAQFFKEEFVRLGGTMVGEATFGLGDQDFSSQLLAVAGQDPDVIFMGGAAADEALLVNQARDMGYSDVMFIATDGLDVVEFTELGGEAVKGTVCSTFFDDTAVLSELTTPFVEAYQEEYGVRPPACAALAYDTYLVAYEALKQAESFDGPTLKAILDDIVVEGVTGTIRFDENGDAVKNSLVLKVVGDDGWELLKVYTAEE